MKALFRASRESLGSRTLARKLREEGFEIGRDRTRRLMKALHLRVKPKRKHKATTGSKHQLPVAENVLSRRFNPTGPNQVWGTDITCLWTREGWVLPSGGDRPVFTPRGRVGHGPADEEGAGDPGLADGGQSQEAATGADPPFGSWQSVCQPCIPEAAQAAWHGCEHEPQGQLLG